MLSLIVDRVEPILRNKSICAVFDCRQSRTYFVQQEHLCVLLLHKIGSTQSSIKDSTGALVA